MRLTAHRLTIPLAAALALGSAVSTAHAQEPTNAPKKVASVEGITEYRLRQRLAGAALPRRVEAQGDGRT